MTRDFIGTPLIDLVKDQKVHFSFYRDKELWYETDKGFVFPVPITDAGTATFLRDDKAILYMRYIRKYKEEMEKDSIGGVVETPASKLCMQGG